MSVACHGVRLQSVPILLNSLLAHMSCLQWALLTTTSGQWVGKLQSAWEPSVSYKWMLVQTWLAAARSKRDMGEVGCANGTEAFL
ncbi:hypothetical protein KP509_07G029200 [Ceratopteris richardii]|uniref:Secreted protein n=1 Tax=Ceratopteris richardii TaxID=49495 RepID=A0A8T2UGX2_CERRI|nr:hypothetical protein KP509_07G029200 [Ceratopteris richardii]